VLFGYSAFGTITTTLIGKRLITLNFTQLQTEADFRYSLIRIRENAESVAFYGGEERESKVIKKRFGAAVNNFQALLSWQRNLEFFTNAYKYLIRVLPSVAIAPLYFEGSVGLGVVNQSNSAFNHVLNDLSIIISRYESLSQFSAGVDRLGEFSEYLEKKVAEEQSEDGQEKRKKIELSYTSKATVEIKDLRLATPDGTRLLINNLNLKVEEGERLLIVGPSGCGKSSLLRAVAGLWRSGSGSIERTTNEDVLFLPQRPYCTLGTLREQLTYPLEPREVKATDEEIMQVLKNVDLEVTASQFGGLDAEQNWSDILSLGEQQRLAFGRLLLRKPKLVILDESSSALDVDAEARLYDFLAKTNATVLSVGHRPTLLCYHDMKLKLGEDNYSHEKIDQESIKGVKQLVL